MTNPELIARCEYFALNQFLSEFPEDMDYDEIIQRLIDDDLDEDGDPIITVWEPFESHPTEVVAEYIEDTYNSLTWFTKNLIEDKLTLEE